MNVILLIVGMMVVTFFPRYLPFVTISKWNLPGFVKKFLRFIPYAALGTLILPGAVMAIPGFPWAAIVGIIAAILFPGLEEKLFSPWLFQFLRPIWFYIYRDIN